MTQITEGSLVTTKNRVPRTGVVIRVDANHGEALVKFDDAEHNEWVELRDVRLLTTDSPQFHKVERL